MANEGDEIAVAESFDPQDAEAVLHVVEGDALDQTGKKLGCGARPDSLHRRRRMNTEISTCYRDRAPSSMWSARLERDALRQCRW